MEKPRFYITTTLPYVNADPHIGFAAEIIRADIIARFQELSGREVFFNTGTDEHGLKIFRAAHSLGKDTHTYVDEFSAKFKNLHKALGLKEGLNFIRTTDPHHIEAAKEFWRRCAHNGFIYKKNYSAKYCVGCELEKTDSELLNGRCPIHPNLDLEAIEEENYFFKFSEFRQKLLNFYESHPSFVLPESRFNEIKSFVSRGLKDFSISRLKEKMPWGVEVPGDPNQIMYVWFDALVNYIAALGWPKNEQKFNEWWKDAENVVQYCGKDNLRQQSAMWQAMLMAAELPNSKQIVINGFVTGEGGIKMSKSLGNTTDPVEIVKEYGTDALRYFVARELQLFEDSPFTPERFKEAYNGNLANGLGNLVSRVLTMASKYNVWPDVGTSPKELSPRGDIILDLLRGGDSAWRAFDFFDIKKVVDTIFTYITDTDREIERKKPYTKIKEKKEEAEDDIRALIVSVWNVSIYLEPILPGTSAKIQSCIREKKMSESSLFPRKD